MNTRPLFWLMMATAMFCDFVLGFSYGKSLLIAACVGGLNLVGMIVWTGVTWRRNVREARAERREAWRAQHRHTMVMGQDRIATCSDRKCRLRSRSLGNPDGHPLEA